MLRALGIIAEFNPLHNGHRHLIKLAKQRTGADVTIAVMSGNWTQRGEPAIVDKWQRTRMALDNGVDLVVELPAVDAVQPANCFALNAMRLVTILKCQWLTFGCEHPQWNFNRLARCRLPHRPAFFHDYRYSYADLIRQYFQHEVGIRLDDPNDLLGFNYARAKRRLRSTIPLIPIARKVMHHSKDLSQSSRFASSSSLRRRLLSLSQPVERVQRWVPVNVLKRLRRPFMSWQRLWPLLRYQLVESSLSDLKLVYQMNEGLEYRLKRAAIQSADFRSFLSRVKTKRYTYSRLLRLCFYVLLKLTREADVNQRQNVYVRPLGFNSRGRLYLHQIKKKLTVPLISVTNRRVLHRELKWEVKAGMLIQMITCQREDLDRHPVVRLARS